MSTFGGGLQLYVDCVRHVSRAAARSKALVAALAAVAGVSSFACGPGDASQREPPAAFQRAKTFRIVSPIQGQTLRFLLKSSAGPVTVVSLGGLRRGSDLRLELVTPAELTLEPGTIDATVTAIGDSGVQLRAVGENMEARGAMIEISNHSIFSHCCSLPKGFQLDPPPR